MTKIRYFLALILTLLHLPVSLLALGVKKERRRAFVFRFYQIYSEILIKYVLGLKVLYIDRDGKALPPNGVYISNHLGYLDIPLFCTKHQVSPIMKAELMKFPGVYQTALLSGAITVSRKLKDDRKRVLGEVFKRLDNKDNIFYFPEGTRSKDGRPMELFKIHTPILKSAYERGVPIVPFSFINTDKIIGKNLELHRNIQLGYIRNRTLYPQNFSDRDEFVKAAWDEVIRGYQELDQLINKS